MQSSSDQLIVLRQPLFGKLFLGALGSVGAGFAIYLGVASVFDGSFSPMLAIELIGFFVASMALAFHFSTTEVYATPDRIWLKRYGFILWSIAMSDAGSTEGTGSDWRFIFIFDLKTGKRVGKFNWFMFDRRDTIEFTKFFDESVLQSTRRREECLDLSLAA